MKLKKTFMVAGVALGLAFGVLPQLRQRSRTALIEQYACGTAQITALSLDGGNQAWRC